MWVCGNKIGWECDAKHLQLTKLPHCSPFPSVITFISSRYILLSPFPFSHTSAFYTQTASLKHIQMQIAAHPHMRWDLELWRRSMPDLKDRTGKRTPKGGAEKFRAWVIEQTATFHHQNSNEQLFRKKKRALNRVDLFRRVKSQRWDQTGLWYFCHV